MAFSKERDQFTRPHLPEVLKEDPFSVSVGDTGTDDIRTDFRLEVRDLESKIFDVFQMCKPSRRHPHLIVLLNIVRSIEPIFLLCRERDLTISCHVGSLLLGRRSCPTLDRRYDDQGDLSFQRRLLFVIF
jgi:hypothetical protein